MRRLAYAALAAVAALMLIIVLMAATPAQGAVHEGRGDFAAGVLGGMTQPTGQLADHVNLSANIGDSGLDLKLGTSAGLYLDYYVMDHLVLGLWGGAGWLHMKQLNVTTGTGVVQIDDMVRGRTVELGGYVKAIGQPRGRWTPNVFAGLTSFHRRAEISRDVLKIFPGVTVFELNDSKLGFTGGGGVEYMATEALGINAIASFNFSGHFTHTFDWSGYQTIVHNWNFNTLGVGMSYHFGVKE